MILKMTNERAINLAIEVLEEKAKEQKDKADKYRDAAICLILHYDSDMRYSRILYRYFSKEDILQKMEYWESVVGADFPKKWHEEMKEDYKYINERWR